MLRTSLLMFLGGSKNNSSSYHLLRIYHVLGAFLALCVHFLIGLP